MRDIVLKRYCNTIALPHCISHVVLIPYQINKHLSWLSDFAIWNTYTLTHTVDGLVSYDVLSLRHHYLSLPRSTFDTLLSCHGLCVIQIQLIHKSARDI